jgi:hypothetical protein
MNTHDALGQVAVELEEIPEMALNYSEWLSAQEPEYQQRILLSRERHEQSIQS